MEVILRWIQSHMLKLMLCFGEYVWSCNRVLYAYFALFCCVRSQEHWLDWLLLDLWLTAWLLSSKPRLLRYVYVRPRSAKGSGGKSLGSGLIKKPLG